MLIWEGKVNKEAASKQSFDAAPYSDIFLFNTLVNGNVANVTDNNDY